MKQVLGLFALLSGSAFAGCNFGNGESLTIADFEYMDKTEVTKYFCDSLVTLKSYDSLAADLKSTMPSMAKDYIRGGRMCRTEIKRSSMVLNKKHGISKTNLAEMKSIINGNATGDNIQRCITISQMVETPSLQLKEKVTKDVVKKLHFDGVYQRVLSDSTVEYYRFDPQLVVFKFSSKSTIAAADLKKKWFQLLGAPDIKTGSYYASDERLEMRFGKRGNVIQTLANVGHDYIVIGGEKLSFVKW